MTGRCTEHGNPLTRVPKGVHWFCTACYPRLHPTAHAEVLAVWGGGEWGNREAGTDACGCGYCAPHMADQNQLEIL